MEALPGETEKISVGRFAFSKVNFEKAIGVIREATYKEGWLVIDELGPLELRGDGFAEVVREVMATRQLPIILVVREGLVNNITAYFNIQGAVLISDINTLK